MFIKSMLVFVCLLPAVSHVNATTFTFDTAEGEVTTSGARLNDNSRVFHRFEITETTRIDTIGGDFANLTSNPLTLFGAIIDLGSDFDNPLSFEFPAPDALRTTTFEVLPNSDPANRGLSTVPVDITLSPGWYALEFGTGALNASSVATSGVHVMMRFFNIDLAPSQTSVSMFRTNSGLITFTPQTEEFGVPRYYVTGNVVPVPAAVWLFGSGLLGLVALARRKKS